MPWDNRSAPNATVEITHACNVACRACYKQRRNEFKTLEQIARDIDDALRLRPIHTLTISGGEPTLHPELCQAVRMANDRDVHVLLLTNGVLVDRDMLKALRDSGLDSILFHVDVGQRRADLPTEPKFDDVRARLDVLTSMAVDEGIDASISAVLYDNGEDMLRAYTEYLFDARHITAMFLSRAVPFPSLHEGCGGSGPDPQIRRVTEFYDREYGIEPFAFIPHNGGNDHMWMSYFVPVAYNGAGCSLFPIRANWLDSWTMRIPKVLTGRYVHKTNQNPRLTLARMAANGFSTFRLRALMQFIRKLRDPGAALRHKMIMYHDGPYILSDGKKTPCEYCPTAIVRDGRLLACCEADYGNKDGSAP